MFVIPFHDLTEWQDVGSGCFGRIFKADYLGTLVAIKEFIDISQLPTFDLKKYTDREITLLQECRHPNVVQFMGCTENERKIYAVTEFVDGGTLKELILNTNKTIRWRTRIAFAEDCARALAYLHSRDIIHRDLKSENLLITENKRVKVCDFGLSREKPRTMDEQRRLSFCGTDAYMAPEMALGMAFDTAVDIFSFGIILLELIFGLVGDTPNHYPPNTSRSKFLDASTPRMDSDKVHPLFWRVIPGFGLDTAMLKKLCPNDCPPNLLDLAIQCVAENPKERPTLKYILSILRDVEKYCLKLEIHQGNANMLNIGIISGSDLASYLSAADISLSESQDSIYRSRAVPVIQEGNEVEPAHKRDADSIIPTGRPQAKESDASLLNPLSGLPASQPNALLSPTHPSLLAVPHRFSLTYLLTRTKCKVCAQGFRLTSRHLVCDDCGYQVHKKCGKDAPASCGQAAESIRVATSSTHIPHPNAPHSSLLSPQESSQTSENFISPL